MRYHTDVLRTHLLYKRRSGITLSKSLMHITLYWLKELTLKRIYAWNKGKTKSRINHHRNKGKDISFLHILPNLFNLQGGGMTSCTGRLILVLYGRRRLTVRIWPSLSRSNSSIRAFFHMCLGILSSCKRTMYPALNLGPCRAGVLISW